VIKAQDRLNGENKFIHSENGRGKWRSGRSSRLEPPVPGSLNGHCAGGEKTLDQFNMRDALVDWVEKDIAPERVEATGRAFPDRSRPWCPFPQYARYMGEGDPEDAANFECRNPE
jgi:hypothetical protein